MPTTYVAVEDKTFYAAGILQVVQAGVTLVSEDSDLYRSHPELFEPYAGERGVEQATAAPGEHRNITIQPEEET